MTDRQHLIDGVKAEYQRLADMESRDSFVNMSAHVPPEAFYEELLAQVIAGIEAGRFDRMASGREIVEAVAKNREQWGIRIE